MMKRVLSAMLAIVIAVTLIAYIPPEAEAASMYASQEVIEFLKDMEGFNAIPHWDYAQWSVGFGNRCPDEHLERYQKEGIPIEEAHALFAQQLSGFVGQVNTFLNQKGIVLEQHQFDALLSLTYNKGGAWMQMNNEPVVDAVLEKDMGNKFIAAISLTSFAGGNFLWGLMRRRLLEADMYLNGIYGHDPRENYCYVRYDGNGGHVSRSVQGYDVELPVEFYSYATYEGHTFLGWFTAPEGGEQITQLTKDTNKMTLYAQWAAGTQEEPFQPITVTITSYRINVRNAPGTKNDVVTTIDRDTQVSVLEIREMEGIPWGRIAEGWISLAYTDYKPAVQEPEIPTEPSVPTEPTIPAEPSVPTEPTVPSQPLPTEPVPTEPTPSVPDEPEIVLPPSQDPLPGKLPMTGTVVGSEELTVHNGPHTSYPQIGTLKVGQSVKITETYELQDILWGKLEQGGWVRIYKNILYDDYAPAAHPVTVSVTVWYSYVRSGPSTDFGWFRMVQKKDQLQITKLRIVDGDAWGLCQYGWVFLENTDFDLSKYEYYLNHTYGDWYHAADPSCSQSGQERRDCIHCEHSDIIYTGYLPHEYGPWEDSREATCVLPGQQSRSCAVCGHQEVRNLELGDHSCGDWRPVTAATCTSPGQERRDCIYCSYYETRLTALVPHSFGQWYETLTPTNTETGLERRDCADCDHYEERILPVTEHIYSDWFTKEPATCTEDGIAARSCSHCDLIQERVIPATGHSLGQWEVHTPASCTQTGVQRRSCASCDYFEEKTLEPVGHTLGPWMVHTPAGCEQPGSDRRTCLYCDHYESRDTEATGHAYGPWKVITAPTYQQEGSQRRDCDACDGFQVSTIDKLPMPQQKLYGTLTAVDSLIVRSGPAGGFPKVGVLVKGTRVEIYERRQVAGEDWGRIEQGWIPLNVLTLETWQVLPPQTVLKTYATVTTDVLNIREGPGIEYAKAGKLYTGDWLEVFEQQVVGKRTWARTELGWICLTENAEQYASLETVEETVQPDPPEELIPPVVEPELPPAPEEPEPPQPAEKIYGVLTGYFYLNIRQGPGTHYPKLGTLNYGQRVEILEQKPIGDVIWGRIQQGWICITDYITLETGEQTQDSIVPEVGAGEKLYATVITDALSLRQGPGTEFFRLGFLFFGARLEVLEHRKVGDRLWGKTARGWICLTEYTRLQASAETNSVYMVVNTDVLRVRAGAGTSYEILSRVYMGDKLRILEETVVDEQAWVRIEQGWVCKEYLAPAE